MTSELIGIKVKSETKAQILDLIESGKYRNVSDFMHTAIKTQLEKDSIDEREVLKTQFIDLVTNDPEVRDSIVNLTVYSTLNIGEGLTMSQGHPSDKDDDMSES